MKESDCRCNQAVASSAASIHATCRSVHPILALSRITSPVTSTLRDRQDHRGSALASCEDKTPAKCQNDHLKRRMRFQLPPISSSLRLINSDNSKLDFCCWTSNQKPFVFSLLTCHLVCVCVLTLTRQTPRDCGNRARLD